MRLHVRGASMLPALYPGDVAEIQACSLDDVATGEIVLAFREDRFFLHRFMSRNENHRFVARGDSMPGADPTYTTEQFVGRLVAATRNGQPVSLTARPWTRALGLLFCYSSIARRIALRLHHSRNLQRLPGADLEIA
ncbi:MAG: S24/S26 family peptidase [Acidobacteria bacterium]|nr:S24/S26 family peptidase [Acidobacteriota bacterium]